MANWTGAYFILLLYSIAHDVSATGRMLLPPQRSSLWRDPIQKYNPRVAKNFEDHRLNCGGLWRMKQNGGNCGVCGDPWDKPEPRPNEAGGEFAQGIIGRTYFPTDRFIPVKLEILSNIDGYFEFKLCPNNDVNKKVTPACLDRNQLNIFSEDKWTNYGTRFYPDLAPVTPGNISFALEIPTGMTCRQCVLQWNWRGGNNWGKCPNGSSATGCGPQIEFKNCADIAILGSGDPVPANVPGNSLQRQSLRDVVTKVIQAQNAGAPGLDPKRGPKPINGRNINPSILANGIPKTTTREASPLDILRRNMMSNNNPRTAGVREPIMPLLATMFGRGNGMNSANIASAFRDSIMSQSRSVRPFSTGRNFRSASPLSNLIGVISPNRQNTMLRQATRNSPLEAHRLEWALNPNNKAAEFFTMSLLLPLLRNDLRMSMSAMNQLAMNNMASGYPAVDRLLAYLQVLHNTSGTAGSMPQNQGQNDVTQLLAQGRRGGLNMPMVEQMMNFRRIQTNSTTGNRSVDLANMGVSGQQGINGGAPNASTAPDNPMSQLATLLGSGTGAQDMALTPELLMMSLLLKGRSRGSSGGEAGEGSSTSRLGPLMMMLNPELGMMASLLGGRTQAGSEGAEGGQRSSGASMNPQMKALATLFGSRTGGESAMSGHGSPSIGLGSLFGRRSQGGSEGTEGGRGSSRMSLASLFGGRGGGGGEAAEGGHGSRGMGLSSLFGTGRSGGDGGEGGRGTRGMGPLSMILPVLLGSNTGFGGIMSAGNPDFPGGNQFGLGNPFSSSADLMLLSSLFGRGSGGGRGGEAAEGGEGGRRGGGGMSNLPLLAMMLGDGFGGTQTTVQQTAGPDIAQGLLPKRPQISPYGGLGLPGMQPMNVSPMLKPRSSSPISPPLLGAPVNRGLPRSTSPINPVSSMPRSLSPIIPSPGSNAMHAGKFVPPSSPSVSLLDLYRLTGGLRRGGRSRMID